MNRTPALRDEHGRDGWIWAELLGDDFPPEAQPSLTASGDFDEAEHPRDEHGRWTDSAAIPHDEAGGFRQLAVGEREAWATQQMIADGRPPEKAAQTARILYGADRKGGYEVHVRLDGTHVEFAARARVSAAAKADVLQATADLQALYPDQRPRSVSVAETSVAKSLAADAIGMTVRGNDHIVLAADAVKPAGVAGIKEAAAAGRFMPAATADEVSGTRYVLFHEWGHTMDTPRGRERPAETQSALNFIPAGSAYGRYSQGSDLAQPGDRPVSARHRDGSEAFAESFAEWHLTRGQTQDPLARALANSEGWRKFRGG